MNSQDRYSRENMLKVDTDLLRAIIRERTHHTVEPILYRAVKGKFPVRPNHGRLVKRLLEVWKDRGMPRDLPDINWAEKMLSYLKQIKQGKSIDLNIKSLTPFSDEEMQIFEKAIFKRRSIRFFSKKKVPRPMIKKIIKAGLWAPHSCNLQTTRVLIIDDEKGISSFKSGEVEGVLTYLVICQDYRPYEFFKNIPEYNRFYDVGAAAQNMLLMAHAQGLGAVWLTFGKEQEMKIRETYNLPKHIRVSTYIALGWPVSGAIAPDRIAIDDAII